MDGPPLTVITTWTSVLDTREMSTNYPEDREVHGRTWWISFGSPERAGKLSDIPSLLTVSIMLRDVARAFFPNSDLLLTAQEDRRRRSIIRMHQPYRVTSSDLFSYRSITAKHYYTRDASGDVEALSLSFFSSLVPGSRIIRDTSRL